MKTAVRYYSQTGHTETLAKAIAEAAACSAQPIAAPLDGFTDVLFLGAAVYWGGISPEVKNYIRTLDKSKIGKVGVFSTSSLAQRAFPSIRKELLKRGIKVEEEHFYCRSQFKALYRGRPDQNDLKAARDYAVKILKP